MTRRASGLKISAPVTPLLLFLHRCPFYSPRTWTWWDGVKQDVWRRRVKRKPAKPGSPGRMVIKPTSVLIVLYTHAHYQDHFNGYFPHSSVLAGCCLLKVYMEICRGWSGNVGCPSLSKYSRYFTSITSYQIQSLMVTVTRYQQCFIILEVVAIGVS